MRTCIGFAVALVALVSACGGSSPEPAVIRLVDVFDAALVEGGPQAPPDMPRTEWRFEDGQGGWKAGPGVAGLGVVNGRLTGRATSDFPLVHVERTSGLDDPDVLHAIEVRARTSTGGTLSVTLDESETVNFPAVLGRARRFPWPFRTPLVPGDEFQTYTIVDSDPLVPSFPASSTRHVLLRPVDEAGADFEIESVRLIFRKEHLASIPSGVSWQGFENVFRETIVTRSPETARFELELPSRPWLDLAVGTVEDGSVTFTVGLEAPGEAKALFTRTLTTPHRWEISPVPLDELAGKRVTLTLSLASDKEGALGFWGAPAVRNRGARPPVSEGARVTSSPPRGVILFVADTLRRDHLELYGYHRDTTPHLTRLASEGALFEDTQSQGTWTKVAVPSIHASLYPTTHGIASITDRLPVAATTLAEVYREAGYATISFSSVTFSGKGSNLHQGFEELHERASLDVPERRRSKTARPYLDRLVPWLEAHRDVPFFVFFHVMDPHSPFEPHRPYDTLWAEPGAGAEHARRTEHVLPFIENAFMKAQELPTREELAEAGIDAEAFVGHELDWYDGSIRAMDVELARLMETLERLGIADDTLVAFISDHGEEFLEHGQHWHGNTVYGDMSNVPLVLWGPGRIPAGTRISELVQSIDLMPTLLELSHLPIPEAAQGQSLVPLLLGSLEGFRSRPAFVERHARADEPDEASSVAVVTEGWKLVHNFELPVGEPGYPVWELYDHVKDPLNLVNVAGDHPEVVERLKRLLEDWRKFATAAKLPADEEAAEGMDPEELERLRSLGYVQ